MVNQTNDTIVREIETPNENETSAAAAAEARFPQLLSKRLSSASAENLSNDDLIAVLSDRRENRRARQVFEWERTRRQLSFPRAA